MRIPIGSKIFDTIMLLYNNGRIEIRMPNSALGWIPLGTKPPTIERHIDGFYFIFEEKNKKSELK